MNIIQTLPNHWYRAICSNWYRGDKQNTFCSVTALLQPVKQFVLKKRHSDEITVKDIDLLWSMSGSALHEVLAKSEGKNALIEERLIMDICGEKVGGGFDVYEDNVLYDNKETSVWTIIHKKKLDEWAKQLNMYRLFLESIGFPVERMEIDAKLKDWNYWDAIKDPDYPQSDLVQIPIPKIDVLPYMQMKVVEFRDAMRLPDDSVSICSEGERWNETKYAVMKAGNKQATRVFDSYYEASRKQIELGPNYSVETRQGIDKRCIRYCVYRAFCNHAKERGYV